MSIQVITNSSGELCDHGWIHKDRATSINMGGLRLLEAASRRVAAVDLTVVPASECFEQGRELLQVEQFEEAAERFRAAVQLDWGFINAHIELGNALSVLRDFQGARQSYENALEVDGSSVLAHYNIAVTCADVGDREGAREWLLRTVRLDGNYRPAYLQLARLSCSDHSAIALLLKAAHLRPRIAEPLVEAGNIYYKNTEYGRALRCYKRAVRIDPWFAEGFLRLGLAYYRNGQLPEAGIALANAVNRDPSCEVAVNMLKGIERRLSMKVKRSTVPVQSELFASFGSGV